MAVTVALTAGEDTWRGMVSFGGWLVALLFVVVFLRMVLESLSLLVLVNGTQDGKITLIEALELTIEGYFISQLIPISAAGVPYQAFILTRKGVRAGWATAVVLVKGFVPGVFFFFVLMTTIVVAALGWDVPDQVARFLKIVGPLSAVPLIFIVTMLIIMIRYPSLFAKLIDRGASFLARRLRGRAADRVEEVRHLLEEESQIFREALTTIGRHKRWILLWGIVLVILMFLAEFMLAVIILWGFGYRGPIVGPIVLQCLLKPVIMATPTPGSLAFGEGGYIAFFAAFLPAHFVGVSLVLWRLVLYFVPMFAGGVLVAKRIGRGFVTARVGS
ncbi:MAG: flippase-like domain-containing protein [Candidatus Eisenbacteria bacterium]|nr:flippase-like domain-containing protein [Candidatus Eisenbacteria bacterium]